MIVKIVTKGEATGFDTDVQYIQFFDENFQILEESELPDVYVERFVYDNPFIEVYLLIGY